MHWRPRRAADASPTAPQEIEHLHEHYADSAITNNKAALAWCVDRSAKKVLKLQDITLLLNAGSAVISAVIKHEEQAEEEGRNVHIFAY